MSRLSLNFRSIPCRASIRQSSSAVDRWVQGLKPSLSILFSLGLSFCTCLPGIPSSVFAQAIPADAILPTPLDSTAAPAAGQFAVSDNGAATYSYPIWVPDGRRDLKPSLSLVYNSQVENGLLGVGWALSGLSSITRCKRDMARDGYNEAIQFDSTDAFCLDGQRLIAFPSVADGITRTYGTEGTEYRTEQEQFAQIINGRVDERGPVSFEVRLKNGLILYYGISQDSRVEGKRMSIRRYQVFGTVTVVRDFTQAVRLKWALAEVRDRFGNNMTVQYSMTGDVKQGYEQRPTFIHYTGTVDQSLPARREVRFTYESRPDTQTSFISGLKLVTSHRLVKIVLAAPNPTDTAPVKEYVLDYKTSTATNRSLLQTISECDPQRVCLRPTTLSYSNTAENEYGFTDVSTDIHDDSAPPNWSTPSFDHQLGRLVTGDINGDGCDDLIYSAYHKKSDDIQDMRGAYRLSSCYDAISDGSPPLPPPTPDTFLQLYPPINGAADSTVPGLVFNPPLIRGGKPLCKSDSVILVSCRAQLTGIDFDLDGRMDLLAYPVSEHCGKPFPEECVYSTAWRQTFDTNIFLASSIPPVQWNPESGLYGGRTHSRDETETAKSVFSDKPPSAYYYFSTYVGDINGDGYPDLTTLTTKGWSFQLNHGRASGQVPPQPNCGTSGRPCLNLDASSPSVPGTAPTEGLTNVFMTDVFREGTTSLILRDTAGSNWYAAYRLSTKGCPAGTVVCPRLPAPNLGLMAGDAQNPARRDWFLDVNGDGLPDSVSIPLAGGRPYFSINTGNGFDAPQEVLPNGVGRIDSVAVLDYDGNGTQDMVFSGETFAAYLSVMRTSERGGAYLFVPLKNQHGKFIRAGSNLQTFDVNGDGLMDLVQIVDGVIHVYIRQGMRRDLLQTISDRGAVISVSYAPLTHGGLYSTSVPPGVVASSASSSTYVVNKGSWVVESYSVPRAGSLDQKVRNQYSYTYADGRHDLSGRGWLGFGSVTTVDHQTHAKTTRTYDNATKVGSAYPFAHRPKQVEHITKLSDSGRINAKSEITVYHRTGTDDGRYSVVLPQQVIRQESEGPSAGPETRIRNVVTQFNYDGFGNVTKSTRITEDGYWEEGVYSFQQNLSAWLISMSTRSVVTSGVPGGASEKRTSTYVPDPKTGIILEEAVEPDGDNDSYLHIAHHYDAHGVQTGSTANDKTGSDTRCVVTEYDAELIYPTGSVNQLGHSTRVAIHPALGTATLFEDPNGVRETRQYDTFGRLRTVRPANGANLSVAYSSQDFPFLEATDVAGQAVRISYDAFQNVLKKTWIAFDGQPVAVLHSYNSQDLIAETEGPCYLDQLPCATTGLEQYLYDELGRLIWVRPANGSVRKVTYSGLTTTYVNELGNQRWVLEDHLGRAVKSVSVSAEGKEVPVSYRYGPFGLLASIADPANNTFDSQYDIRGRVRTLHDPDRGTQGFQWSPFDELREARDGNDLVTTYYHDRLGRVIKVADPKGITLFRWDTAAHGIGLLDRSKSPDGIESMYTYDALARTSTVASKIDGKAYEVKLTYDGLGRLSTIAYPEFPNHPRFTIQQQFNDFGYLQQVVDEPSQLVYWKVDRANARGQVIHEVFGNGLATSRRFDDQRGFLRKISTSAAGNTIQELRYEYEPTGSLQSRTSRFPDSSLVETFHYDVLERLKKWSASSHLPDASQTTKLLLEHVFEYDDLGNLRLRSMSSPGGPEHTLTYRYGENGAGPHAVTHVNDDAYGYNPGGNQIAGPGRTVRYTSFNLPSHIVTGNKQFDLKYDASHVRAVMGDSTGDRTIYVGGLYEKRVHNGHATHVFYVPGLSNIIAQVERDETSGKQSILYLHHDHLASVQATTNQAGNVAGRANYEPFGGTVDAADPSKPSPNALGGVALGFTEHSTDTELNLINMKGRIYDPKIGRFLTPDPLISDPAQSESLNPYSYVRNNPLKWVDPSGFLPEKPDAPLKPLGADNNVKYVVSETIVVIGHRDGTSTSYTYYDPDPFGTSATYDDNGTRAPSWQVRPEREVQHTGRQVPRAQGCEAGCRLAKAMFDPNLGARPTTQLDKVAIGLLAAPVVTVGLATAVATIGSGALYYGFLREVGKKAISDSAWKALPEALQAQTAEGALLRGIHFMQTQGFLRAAFGVNIVKAIELLPTGLTAAGEVSVAASAGFAAGYGAGRVSSMWSTNPIHK